MNSIHRIGLTIAGVATAAVISGAFVIQGYVGAQQAQAQATAQATAADTPGATATLPPQTIYVNPVPSPETIHVTQTAPPLTGKPPVIHVIVPSVGGGDDGGSDD
jgi:hypothetical protein